MSWSWIVSWLHFKVGMPPLIVPEATNESGGQVNQTLFERVASAL